MDFLNLSDKPLQLNVRREGLLKLILLPDYSPAKRNLPVGAVAVYDKNKHVVTSNYLGSDAGCGMTLGRFAEQPKDLEYLAYKIAARLPSSRTLGNLGSGNHFLNLYEVKESKEQDIKKGDLLVLIHSGTGFKGRNVYEKNLLGDEYLKVYNDLIVFSRRNREDIMSLVQECSDREILTVIDKPHNTLELTGDKVIYRKGAVKLSDSELSVIPSSMIGEALLVRGKATLSQLEWSMCHGTGRKISRGNAKDMDFDSRTVTDRICVPSTIRPFVFNKSEAPHCYRTIEEVILKIENYVEVAGRLTPRAFIS